MQVGSIAEGLRRLQQGHWERNGHATAQRDSSECDQQAQFSLGRVFIIGGAEIYATALKMDCCERILWTRIEKEYECDVWFPKLTLGAGEDEKDEGVWQKKKERDLDEWCGEVGVGERKEEGGIGFRVEMWEKLTPDSELG